MKTSPGRAVPEHQHELLRRHVHAQILGLVSLKRIAADAASISSANSVIDRSAAADHTITCIIGLARHIRARVRLTAASCARFTCCNATACDACSAAHLYNRQQLFSTNPMKNTCTAKATRGGSVYQARCSDVLYTRTAASAASSNRTNPNPRTRTHTAAVASPARRKRALPRRAGACACA